MSISVAELSGVGLLVQDLETLRKLLPFLTKEQVSNGNGNPSNGHSASSNGSAHQASIPPFAPPPPPSPSPYTLQVACILRHGGLVPTPCVLAVLRSRTNICHSCTDKWSSFHISV